MDRLVYAVLVAASSADWEQRVADLWASIDDHGEEQFVARMEELAAELPRDSAVAAFERGASFDSTGHSDLAVPLYRQALELGLEGERRRRAVIQMASSLRNIGRAPESVALLTPSGTPVLMSWTTRSVPSSRLLSSTRGVSVRQCRSL